MGYKIQFGQIEGLEDEFSDIRTDLTNTGAFISQQVSNSGYILQQDIDEVASNLFTTGDYLLTKILNTGSTLSTRLIATGRIVDLLSGRLNGLSGDLLATGVIIDSKLDRVGGMSEQTYIPSTVTNLWDGQLITLAGDNRSLEEIFNEIDNIAALGGDNMGNHTASQNLKMNSFGITGASYISGQVISGSGGALTVSTGTWNNNLLGIAGNIQAALDAIDNLSIGGAGDNLGNHTATGNLNMASFNITGAVGISGSFISGQTGVLSHLTSATVKTNTLTSETTISVPVSLVMGADIDLNTFGIQNANIIACNVLSVAETIGKPPSEGGQVPSGYFLWLSGKNIYGTGDEIKISRTYNGNLFGSPNDLSGLFETIDNLALGASDNLGDHTATQNLNLNGFDITGADEVSGRAFYGSGGWLTVSTGLWNNNLLGVAGNIQDALDSIDNLTIGDNLGDHIATQRINLNGNILTGASAISGTLISGSSGQFASLFAPVFSTQEINSANGSEIMVNADVEMYGLLTVYNTFLANRLNVTETIGHTFPVPSGKFDWVSGENIHGSGSSIRVGTGTFNGNLLGTEGTLSGLFEKIDSLALGTSDNLGNHVATQNLEMSAFNIENAGDISGTIISGNSLSISDTATVNGTLYLGGIVTPSLDGITLTQGGLNVPDIITGLAFTGDGQNITLNNTGWNQNLNGVGNTLQNFADAVDNLTLGGGPSSQSFSVPFNYMSLSKVYTTGSLGWAVEESDVYNYSAAGYESSHTTVVHSGTAWIDLAIPRAATGFAPTGALEFTIVGNNTNSANCKIDFTYYTSSGNMTQVTTRKNVTGITVASANVPELLSYNASSLANESLSGHTRGGLKIEWYSKSGCSIKLIAGQAAFVG